ncbi:MAG: flagellar biosynthesis protein FlhF [Lachnospiraceae bacterium]|nr:flagellar biosynthesis protein FlhF [Lachnospiraceae bacterium]
MIIKKFKAPTEKEAILLAKEELGPSAIVMNVKTIKPSGLLKLFKKTRVELTAAIDDNIADKSIASDEAKNESKSTEKYVFGTAFDSKKSNKEHELTSEEAKNAIEEKINNIAKLLEQQMNSTKSDIKSDDIIEEYLDDKSSSDNTIDTKSSDKPRNKVIELVRNQLIENEVCEKYVDMIIEELDADNPNQPIDNILASVYQKIVLKLGEIEALKAGEKKPKIVFIVGNTGVGKTTTLAKLASKCILEDKMRIAILSVDTYRIAAIEQTKTFASILNAPFEVVYTPEDMQKYVEKYKECDLILVDTAGRSHRDESQKNDLKVIVDSVNDYEKEVYLVLSVTVKYKDLLNMAQVYDQLFDYKIIFTKLDETKGVGSILNLKLDMDKTLSYVTWGQNVPDDIGLVNPQIIAKKLLGGEQ